MYKSRLTFECTYYALKIYEFNIYCPSYISHIYIWIKSYVCNFLSRFMSLSVEGIKEMFTIEQIKQAVGKGSTQAEAVSGIVFAYLTNFNIDGNMDQVLALRWYVSCWNLIRV